LNTSRCFKDAMPDGVLPALRRPPAAPPERPADNFTGGISKAINQKHSADKLVGIAFVIHHRAVGRIPQ
jgi:hypothetical protein